MGFNLFDVLFVSFGDFVCNQPCNSKKAIESVVCEFHCLLKEELNIIKFVNRESMTASHINAVNAIIYECCQCYSFQMR